MPERTQVEKTKTERKTEEVTEVKKSGQQAKGEELKAAIDDILDDIDEVLNAEAVEMTANFIQKGGQ